MDDWLVWVARTESAFGLLGWDHLERSRDFRGEERWSSILQSLQPSSWASNKIFMFFAALRFCSNKNIILPTIAAAHPCRSYFSGDAIIVFVAQFRRFEQKCINHFYGIFEKDITIHLPNRIIMICAIKMENNFCYFYGFSGKMPLPWYGSGKEVIEWRWRLLTSVSTTTPFRFQTFSIEIASMTITKCLLANGIELRAIAIERSQSAGNLWINREF